MAKTHARWKQVSGESELVATLQRVANQRVPIAVAEQSLLRLSVAEVLELGRRLQIRASDDELAHAIATLRVSEHERVMAIVRAARRYALDRGWL